MHHLVLEMSGIRFALSSESVLEVISGDHMEATPLEGFAGFVPWREGRVPVVDPQVMQLAEGEIQMVALVRSHGAVVGIPADFAVGVVRIASEEVDPPAPGMPAWITGVWREAWLVDPELLVKPVDVARVKKQNEVEFLSWCAELFEASDSKHLRAAAEHLRKHLKEDEK